MSDTCCSHERQRSTLANTLVVGNETQLPPHLRLSWQKTQVERLNTVSAPCFQYSHSRDHDLNKCFIEESEKEGFIGSSAMVSEDMVVTKPVRREDLMSREELQTVARIRDECERRHPLLACSSTSYRVIRQGIPETSESGTASISLLYPSHPEVHVTHVLAIPTYEFVMNVLNFLSFYLGQGPIQLLSWLLTLFSKVFHRLTGRRLVRYKLYPRSLQPKFKPSAKRRPILIFLTILMLVVCFTLFVMYSNYWAHKTHNKTDVAPLPKKPVNSLTVCGIPHDLLPEQTLGANMTVREAFDRYLTLPDVDKQGASFTPLLRQNMTCVAVSDMKEDVDGEFSFVVPFRARDDEYMVCANTPHHRIGLDGLGCAFVHLTNASFHVTIQTYTSDSLPPPADTNCAGYGTDSEAGLLSQSDCKELYVGQAYLAITGRFPLDLLPASPDAPSNVTIESHLNVTLVAQLKAEAEVKCQRRGCERQTSVVNVHKQEEVDASAVRVVVKSHSRKEVRVQAVEEIDLQTSLVTGTANASFWTSQTALGLVLMLAAAYAVPRWLQVLLALLLVALFVWLVWSPTVSFVTGAHRQRLDVFPITDPSYPVLHFCFASTSPAATADIAFADIFEEIQAQSGMLFANGTFVDTLTERLSLRRYHKDGLDCFAAQVISSNSVLTEKLRALDADRLPDPFMMLISIKEEHVERMGYESKKFVAFTHQFEKNAVRGDMIEIALSRRENSRSFISFQVIDQNGLQFFPLLDSEEEAEDMDVFVIKPKFVYKITDELEVTFWCYGYF